MTYCGNRLFNTNNVFLLFGLSFGTAIFIQNAHGIGSFTWTITLLSTLNEAFYFKLTTDKFIVKNYLLPFINITYELSEITTIELAGTNYKATADAALKVTHGDKTSMGFRAASLNLKDWQALTKALDALKIPVIVSASRLIDKIDLPTETTLD